MDIQQLITDSKARYNHNASKAQLNDKYDSKLIVAAQGGLWKADAQTISLLATLQGASAVLIDTFGSPVKVDRLDLLKLLARTYETVTTAWYEEWKALESKR